MFLDRDSPLGEPGTPPFRQPGSQKRRNSLVIKSVPPGSFDASDEWTLDSFDGESLKQMEKRVQLPSSSAQGGRSSSLEDFLYAVEKEFDHVSFQAPGNSNPEKSPHFDKKKERPSSSKAKDLLLRVASSDTLDKTRSGEDSSGETLEVTEQDSEDEIDQSYRIDYLDDPKPEPALSDATRSSVHLEQLILTPNSLSKAKVATFTPQRRGSMNSSKHARTSKSTIIDGSQMDIFSNEESPNSRGLLSASHSFVTGKHWSREITSDTSWEKSKSISGRASAKTIRGGRRTSLTNMATGNTTIKVDRRRAASESPRHAKKLNAEPLHLKKLAMPTLSRCSSIGSRSSTEQERQFENQNISRVRPTSESQLRSKSPQLSRSITKKSIPPRLDRAISLGSKSSTAQENFSRIPSPKSSFVADSMSMRNHSSQALLTAGQVTSEIRLGESSSKLEESPAARRGRLQIEISSPRRQSVPMLLPCERDNKSLESPVPTARRSWRQRIVQAKSSETSTDILKKRREDGNNCRPVSPYGNKVVEPTIIERRRGRRKSLRQASLLVEGNTLESQRQRTPQKEGNDDNGCNHTTRSTSGTRSRRSITEREGTENESLVADTKSPARTRRSLRSTRQLLSQANTETLSLQGNDFSKSPVQRRRSLRSVRQSRTPSNSESMTTKGDSFSKSPSSSRQILRLDMCGQISRSKSSGDKSLRRNRSPGLQALRRASTGGKSTLEVEAHRKAIATVGKSTASRSRSGSRRNRPRRTESSNEEPSVASGGSSDTASRDAVEKSKETTESSDRYYDSSPRRRNRKTLRKSSILKVRETRKESSQGQVPTV